MIIIVNIYLLYARHSAQSPSSLSQLIKWLLQQSLGFTPCPLEIYPTMRIVCLMFLSPVHICAWVNIDVYVYILCKGEIRKVNKGLKVSYRLWWPPRGSSQEIKSWASLHDSRFGFWLSCWFLWPTQNCAEWFSFTVHLVWDWLF